MFAGANCGFYVTTGKFHIVYKVTFLFHIQGYDVLKPLELLRIMDGVGNELGIFMDTLDYAKIG